MFSKRTHTFEELRVWLLRKMGVNDHFQLRNFSLEYSEFWHQINQAEYDQGYVYEEYIKPDTPALCEMKLLTVWEMCRWKLRFLILHRSHSRKGPHSHMLCMV